MRFSPGNGVRVLDGHYPQRSPFLSFLLQSFYIVDYGSLTSCVSSTRVNINIPNVSASFGKSDLFE